MPRRFPVLLLACLLALAGCSSLQGTGDKGFVSGEGQIVRKAVEDREPPIELVGEDLQGEELSLAAFRGQAVVVVVWGSWCGPCRAEAPDLVAAAEELAADDVAFLGINSRDLNQAAARAFVRRFDVPYPSIYDQGGRTLLAFRGTLTANSIPSTVIIDEQGRVAARVLGEVSKSTLVGLVEDVQAGAA